MKILDRLISEFKEAFQYFKERDKSKYYGDRFEEWVVINSNINKNCFAEPDSGNYWKLLEWRGDKYVNGYRPLSSSSPDLLLGCNCSNSPKYKVGEMIAVECKWRSEKSFFLAPESVKKYEKYIAANKSRLSIKGLFYVFGFGWSCGNPESVYVVPANELYTYDVKTGTVNFYKESSEEKLKRLDWCIKKKHECLKYNFEPISSDSFQTYGNK